MKLDKSKAVMMLVSGILGIMLSMQFKTVINLVGFNIFPSEKLKELVAYYDKIQAQKQGTEAYLAELDQQIKAVEAKESGENEEIEKLYDELLKYKMLLGYEDLIGPGVIVEIKDPPIKGDAGKKLSPIVENYNLILQIITILNDNGAEAIAINNQRYTNFTELVPDTDAIKINDVNITPPIKLSAIGNSDELERGLKVKGNVITEMDNTLNYDISIKKLSEIEIKKYNVEEKFKYAQPSRLD